MLDKTGTWSIIASDPQNGSLTYSVNWGDNAPAPLATLSPIQTTTFTHSYETAGNYTITFTVTDSLGLTATSTVTVEIGSGNGGGGGSDIGMISGKTYNDLNGNEMKDAVEPGIAGFTINLYNVPDWSGPNNVAPIMTTTTDASGNYSFSGLADGTYSIEEINMAPWHQDNADYSPVVISNGEVITNMDFANSQVDTTTISSGGGRRGFFFNQGKESSNNQKTTTHSQSVSTATTSDNSVVVAAADNNSPVGSSVASGRDSGRGNSGRNNGYGNGKGRGH